MEGIVKEDLSLFPSTIAGVVLLVLKKGKPAIDRGRLDKDEVGV
jgi:hypothetical protein